MKTVADVLSSATARLIAGGIDSPRLDAEILLAHVLNWRRLMLYVDAEKILPAEKILRFNELIARRLTRIPVAYLVGTKEFFGLNFAVNESVLIPRPETEILVEGVGEFLRGLGREVTFADLGTGSGAIAVSMLKFVPSARAAMVDISAQALQVAKFNAAKFGVEGRAEFFCGDMFAPLDGKIFDAIVSNPPYIPAADISTLQAEVRLEPRLALDGGADGLSFYRRIISDAPKFLSAGGLLAMEVGFNQAAAVKKILARDSRFSDIQTLRDLSGIERVVAAARR
ncbi:MAG: peptide chain release factor N(5)-glutamine methyltransferase [Quinella sp. 2Q5]|nr:peptide chain release factor N(5)-glutamine methyltransferase [Quinella sp. 2Q5]